MLFMKIAASFAHIVDSCRHNLTYGEDGEKKTPQKHARLQFPQDRQLVRMFFSLPPKVYQQQKPVWYDVSAAS